MGNEENFKECYNVEDANSVDLNVYRFEAYDKDMHKYVFIKRKKILTGDLSWPIKNISIQKAR